MKKKRISIIIAMVMAIVIVMVSAVTIYGATAVRVSKTKAFINVGESITLSLKNTSRNYKVSWSSSNNKVAKVNSEGIVTGVEDGETTISAKYRGKSYKTSVNVSKSWSNEELTALINDTIAKSDKLGMKKEDVEKLINQKIAGLSPNVVYVSSGNSSSTSGTPKITPNYACDYKDSNGNIIHFDTIKVDSVKENDYNEFLKCDKVRNVNDGYNRYTVTMTVSGQVALSLAGQRILIQVQAIPDSGNSSRGNLVTVSQDGKFDMTITYYCPEAPKEFILGYALVAPNPEQ